ncbi:MAG: HlyD family type I secretion periplasmic adaptor subunit [Dinoroseobacter sp.]|nr:HlyD family type I secretion periplasmic adaptor subunit [Dinoroseobacter sp.]
MSKPFWSSKLPLTVGYASIAMLLGGIGYWSIKTSIAGAVIAPGVIEVENETQVVQHPDGGVVNSINARNGDLVAEGDVLIELDGTFLRSELSVIEAQLMESFAREARLTAERDEAEELVFSDIPVLASVSASTRDGQLNGQLFLFEARLSSHQREKAQIAEQQRQIGQQIDGLQAQLDGVQKQLDLIRSELDNVQDLFDRGLIQIARVLELQRTEAEQLGDVGRLTAAIAEARTRISALEIEVLRLEDARREEAISELRDLNISSNELKERRRALQEKLGRLQIVAPVSGTVFNSQVAAQRSVVRPAEPVLFLVPADQPLRVAAKIDPVDVDQIYYGQDVTMVFSSFNRRTTPEAKGAIDLVGADVLTDERTGIPYYEASISIDEASMDDLGDLALLPGMPVETFIKTDDRTPLSYLVQPLTVYFSRALREE